MESFDRSDGKEVWFKKTADGSVYAMEIYFPSPIPVGDLISISGKPSSVDSHDRAMAIKKMLKKERV